MSFSLKKWFYSFQATQLFMLVCCLFFCVFIIWSYYCTLDIVSITKGEVVPSTQLKSVEHFEGGIVHKILVKEGDVVKKDDPLVELETTSSDASLQELQLNFQSLSLDLIRLEHEASNKEELVFPKNTELDQYSKFQVSAVFNSRRKTLKSKLQEQNLIMEQKKIDINEIKSKTLKLEERLKLTDEQVTISESLLKDELTNRYKHLDLLKEKNSIESSIAESKSSLEKTHFALKQVEEHASSIQLTYTEGVEAQLKEVIRNKDEIEQRIIKSEDQHLRRVLRAPVDGIVRRLYVFTEGGVVKSGTPVLDIVPVDDKLIIEAMLPIGDIGHVRPGMEAQVLLSSSDARKYGHIMGKVELISPDTINDESGTFYKIIVSTKEDRFSTDTEEYLLVPGLTLAVNILTGSRSILEVIFSPFLERMDIALKER